MASRPLDGVDYDEGEELPGIIATPEQLFAWAEKAKPGDVFVYATRCFLVGGSLGAAAARKLQERNLVFLTQKAIPGRPERNYRATRSSVPYRSDKHAVGRDEDVPLDAEAMMIDVVLPPLKRAARFGRPCPTDRKLAEICGLTVEQVQRTFDVLRAVNAIRVHPAPAPTLRFVTIVETGHRTGLVS